MSKAELFIDKYKQLESLVRSVYRIREQDSIAFYLSEKNEFQQFRDDIHFCRKVRNFLQHEERIDGSFAIEPNDKMIAFLDMLLDKIRNRPKCRDIAVKKADIYTRGYGDRVKETIQVMRRRQYTHVPILEKGKVVGIFDESSVFNYLADHEIVMLEEQLAFRDIAAYVALDNHDAAYVTFVKNTMYVEELQLEFETAYRQGKRIELAFLTANGRANESILGMITPWDILGKGI